MCNKQLHSAVWTVWQRNSLWCWNSFSVTRQLNSFFFSKLSILRRILHDDRWNIYWTTHDNQQQLLLIAVHQMNEWIFIRTVIKSAYTINMHAGQQGYISSTNRCPRVSYLNVVTLQKLTKINSYNRSLKTPRLVKPTLSGKLFHTLTTLQPKN